MSTRPHIASSAKQQDLAFVATTLRSRGLDPKPVPGYADMPGAWDETTRYKRVVERYPWGAIVFLSDRERGEHHTLVIEGELDLDVGKVKGGDSKPVSLPVKWYNEVAQTFPTKGKGQQLPVRIEVPGCLGYHQPDVTCDGGLNESNQVEKPCGWRERCIPLQKHCANAGLDPQAFIKGKTVEWVVQATSKLVAAVGAAPALPPPPQPEGTAATALKGAAAAAPAAEGAAPKATPKAKLPRAAPVKDGSEAAPDPVATFAALKDAIKSAFPDRAVHDDGAPSEDIKPGDLFLVDRSSTSKYISVYAKPAEGHRTALMSFRLRTNMAGVQLPIPKGHDLLKGVDANTVAWKDGAFLSEVKPVPQAVPVATVVAIIQGAVEAGLIKLPPAAADKA